MNLNLNKLITMLRWMLGRLFRWVIGVIGYILFWMLWWVQGLVLRWMLRLWILDCFFNYHRLFRLFVPNLTYCWESLDWNHSIVVFIERGERGIIIVYYLDGVWVLWLRRFNDSLLGSTCPCEMRCSFRLFREPIIIK